MRFGKGATILVFVQVTVFSALVCILSWIYHEQVPDALIYSFFAWFGVEGGCLAWLKVAERNAKTDKQLAAENTALKKEVARLRKSAKKTITALEGQIKTGE